MLHKLAINAARTIPASGLKGMLGGQLKIHYRPFPAEPLKTVTAAAKEFNGIRELRRVTSSPSGTILAGNDHASVAEDLFVVAPYEYTI